MDSESWKLKASDTNLEASKSKKSAVDYGYIRDEFIHFFVDGSHKREVIMRIGYFNRCFCFQQLFSKFLINGGRPLDEQPSPSAPPPPPRQVINIGAGYDTTVFNFAKLYPGAGELPYKVLELDLPVVVRKKIKVIRSKAPFLHFCESNFEGFSMHEEGSDPRVRSKQYSLRSCDLNDLESFQRVLQEEDIDPSAPTLVVSECVMVYLEPEAVRGLLGFVAGRFAQAVFVDYEMFNPFSSFGKMMVKNFKERGVPLVGIDNFGSLPQIEQMYLDGGFDTCKAVDMHTIFTQYLPQQEIQRIRKLEWLDELEEISLIQSHYFISIAKRRTHPLAPQQPPDWFDQLGFGSLSQ